MQLSVIRYPGGKHKLLRILVGHLVKSKSKEKTEIEYREPFFGGGSVGINWLENAPKNSRIWINDKDVGIACLWTSIIQFPERLKDKILAFAPSVEKYLDYKSELLENRPKPNQPMHIVDYGFKKLVVHQTSYSGLGTKAGGPQGGLSQKSKYGIASRWSPSKLCDKIDKLHALFSGFVIRQNSCTSYDAVDVIGDSSSNSLIYLDPPYFAKGQELYQHAFQRSDHDALASVLKATMHRWVLSYDDCPEVRELYDWASVTTVSDVKYSITPVKNGGGKKSATRKSEVVITS